MSRRQSDEAIQWQGIEAESLDKLCDPMPDRIKASRSMYEDARHVFYLPGYVHAYFTLYLYYFVT